MSKIKYTKELLQPVVEASTSYAQVMRKLGLKYSGGTHRMLKARVAEFGIATDHFLGQGWCKGVPARNRKSPDELLIKTQRLVSSDKLKRAYLLLSNSHYACRSCGIHSWQGKQLTLHLDHINGNPLDNRFENLRLLCPNCHQQTDTWGFKKSRQGNKERRVSPMDEIADKSSLCIRCKVHCSGRYCSRNCFNLASRRVERPKKEELEYLIRASSFTAIGKKLGVSDNAVRKWAKTYGLL